MKAKWYAKLVMVVCVMALVAGLVVGCAAETKTVVQTQTTTQTQVSTQTVTTTLAPGEAVTVTTTAPGPTVTTTAAAATVTTTAPGATITQTVTRTVGATPTAPQTFKLRAVSGHTVEAPHVAEFHSFFIPEVNRRLAERTNYKIEWTELWAGTVTKAGEVLEGIQAGLGDIGLPIALFEPSTLPLQGMTYWVPFGVSDMYQLGYVIEKMFEEIPALSATYERDFNQKYIGGFILLPSYQIYSNFPINSVADMKGRKIGGGFNVAWVEPIGAIPTTSIIYELYNNLATGVMDAVLLYRSFIYAYKVHEVAPYEVIVNLGAQVSGHITVNLDTWNRLPPEVQGILEDVAREYIFNQAYRAMREDAQYWEVMKAEGMQTIYFPKEERDRNWVNIMPNLPDKKAKEWDAKGLPGSEVFSAYFKFAEEIGAELPRWWEIT